MSHWEQHDLTTVVGAILQSARFDANHHFGRPYLSSYQVAIEIEHRFPDIFEAIGKPTGGVGSGHTSLAQYVANELSKKIKAEGVSFPVEGVFMAHDHVRAMTFARSNGELIESSLVDGGIPMSMFRWRDGS
ncbi:MAG TPA: hypothetical protein VM677_09175 [Actinokineospora sp.]|jgi:hypothetical protein|nr:hypothetical protein [Actinokineospora sp.]